MRVLISGAGIAGPTLAYWLAHYGLEPTIVEIAPRLRTGGYVIDFWGAGFDIADRMRLMPEIRSKGYMVEEVRVVNRQGKRVAGFSAEAFARPLRDHYITLSRGDLAACIFGRIADKVETIFDDSVSRIEQSEKSVHVTFERSVARDFDLVIGADGLHSRVRELVFGAEEQFERYLGYKAVAFETAGYRPRDELVYVLYSEVGQQVARFSMRDDRTMFLFTFADVSVDGLEDALSMKALLRKRFAGSGWECPEILHALDDSEDIYFDRVSQIHMESWTRGRVALVGDAAFCVSLLAGQGSGLAMLAAYILAGEIHRADGDYASAFQRYQERLGPFLLGKQKAALRFAGTFAPKSRFSLFFRNQVMNLMKISWVAERAVSRDLVDKIEVPEYS